MSPLGFALGAAGGASTGFAPALENIMRMRAEKSYQDRAFGLDERSLGLRADELASRMDQASEEREQRERERNTLVGSGNRRFDDPDALLSWEEAYANARRPPARDPNYQLTWGEQGAFNYDPSQGTVSPVRGPEGQQLRPRPRSTGAGEVPSRTTMDLLPGETPYDRLIRLQEAYGMPISELRRRFQYATEDETDNEIRNQVRSTLRGR